MLLRSHVVLFAGLCAALPASAHVLLDDPARRYDDMKLGPCGRGGGDDGRTDRVTYLDPGQTLPVSWTETIDHTGSFRIAFDEDGDDEADFEDNVLYSSADPANESGKAWDAEIEIPDVECGNCTLQLIQIMTTGEPQDGDLYFQCADVVVGDVASAPAEIGGCGGCASSSPGDAALAALTLLSVLPFSRRRSSWLRRTTRSR